MDAASIGRGFSAFGRYIGQKAGAVTQRVTSVFGLKSPPVSDAFVKTITPDVSKVKKLVGKYEAFPNLKQAIINRALKLVPAGQRAQFLDKLFEKKFSDILEKLVKGRIPHAEYRKMVQSFNSKVEIQWFGNVTNRMLDEGLKQGKPVDPDALSRIFDFMKEIGSYLN